MSKNPLSRPDPNYLTPTVKYEDVYIKSYATVNDVREGLNLHFPFYNKKRPHQSLDYRTPEEIYQGN